MISLSRRLLRVCFVVAVVANRQIRMPVTRFQTVLRTFLFSCMAMDFECCDLHCHRLCVAVVASASASVSATSILHLLHLLLRIASPTRQHGTCSKDAELPEITTLKRTLLSLPKSCSCYSLMRGFTDTAKVTGIKVGVLSPGHLSRCFEIENALSGSLSD